MKLRRAFNYPVGIQASRIALNSFVIAVTLLSGHSAFATQDELLVDMGTQFQRFSKAVLMAERNERAGFVNLRDSRDRFAAELEAVQKSDQVENCAMPDSSAIQTKLRPIATNWESFDRAATMLLTNEDNLRQVKVAVQTINDSEGKMTELTEQINAVKAVKRHTPREISTSAMLVFLQSRLVKNANRILFDNLVDPEVAFLLGKDRNSFIALVDGLLNGSDKFHLPASNGEDKRKLIELSAQFESDNNAVSVILDNLRSIIDVKQATQFVQANSEDFFQGLQQIRNGLKIKNTCSLTQVIHQ